MTSISVVMATYNGAEHIEEQLASLSTQQLLPAELIVSDDGSTDGTVRLVEDFSRTAPFPVLVHRNEQRLGYGANFLQAACLAQGELVAFCDQDDVWRPEKLAVAVEVLATTSADLYIHAATIIDGKGRATGSFSQGIKDLNTYSPLFLGPWSVFYGCSMVFSRSLLTLIDATKRGRHTFEHSGMLSHDLWVYFLATSLGRVAVDPRHLIDYRQHGRNATPQLLGGGLRSWTSSLGVAADAQLPRNLIAADRASLMQELSVSASKLPVRLAAARAEQYWRNVSKYEAARIDMYAEPGTFRRVVKLARILRSGGYRSFRRGGLGRRLLLKDTLAGAAGIRRQS